MDEIVYSTTAVEQKEVGRKRVVAITFQTANDEEVVVIDRLSASRLILQLRRVLDAEPIFNQPKEEEIAQWEDNGGTVD